MNGIALTPSTLMSGIPTFNTVILSNYIPNVYFHAIFLINLGG